MGEEFYNIFVFAEVLMEHQFHLQLFRTQFAMLQSVGFVYELYGNDGRGCVKGDGFPDAVIDCVLV